MIVIFMLFIIQTKIVLIICVILFLTKIILLPLYDYSVYLKFEFNVGLRCNILSALYVPVTYSS